jgi:hypothetical protein
LGAAKPVVPDFDLDLDEDVPELNLVIHLLERLEVVASSNPARLQAQAVGKSNGFLIQERQWRSKHMYKIILWLGMNFRSVVSSAPSG